MNQIDEPNVFLPLAASYDERGDDGYTTTVTNGKDQRKVNSMYEYTVNAMSGKQTLRLRKRPGFLDLNVTMGSASSGSVPCLISVPPVSTIGGVSTNAWMFSLDGDSVVMAHSDATSVGVTVVSQSGVGRWPAYVDRTSLSGVQNLVIQCPARGLAQRVFFSSVWPTFTEITDADFTALSTRGKMEHMDGYALIMESRNRIYNSDSNSLANWTSTSFITKQIEQDVAIGLARLGRIILAFGAETVEGFYNAGNTSGSPLGRIPQLSKKIGLGYYALDGQTQSGTGRRSYYANVGGKLYFLGAEGQPYPGGMQGLGIYVFDGSSFNRVSTSAIDKILFGSFPGNESVDVTNICGMVVEGKQAVAIALSYPNVATQRWLMYFPEWREWFEWTSTYFQPVSNGPYCIGIGGTASVNKLVSGSDPAFLGWRDGVSSSYTMTHQFRLPSRGSHRKRMSFAGVIGDTQTSTSALTVEKSDDDYQTFQNLGEGTIDLTKQNKVTHRCGNYRDRAIRLTHSANTDCRLEAFVAKVK